MKQILLSKDFLEYYDRCVSTVYYPDKFDMSRKHLEKCNEELPNQDPLIKMMLLDTIFFLPSDMLCKVDRASMANSLEVRCPYLGKNVLSILPRYQEKEWIYELKNNFIPSVFTRDKLKEKLELLKSSKKQLNNIILEKSFNEGINHNLNELIITL